MDGEPSPNLNSGVRHVLPDHDDLKPADAPWPPWLLQALGGGLGLMVSVEQATPPG